MRRYRGATGRVRQDVDQRLRRGHRRHLAAAADARAGHPEEHTRHTQTTVEHGERWGGRGRRATGRFLGARDRGRTP